MYYLMTSDSVGGKSERLTHFVKNTLKFGELCSNKSDQHHSILFWRMIRYVLKIRNLRETIVKVGKSKFFST